MATNVGLVGLSRGEEVISHLASVHMAVLFLTCAASPHAVAPLPGFGGHVWRDRHAHVTPSARPAQCTRIQSSSRGHLAHERGGRRRLLGLPTGDAAARPAASRAGAGRVGVAGAGDDADAWGVGGRAR
eukprot:scaffold21164_cov101-Isochrysis_galbana.AAC.2